MVESCYIIQISVSYLNIRGPFYYHGSTFTFNPSMDK